MWRSIGGTAEPPIGRTKGSFMDVSEIATVAVTMRSLGLQREVTAASIQQQATSERRITELLAAVASGGDAGPGGLGRLLDLLA
jgi:hypothetical protein